MPKLNKIFILMLIMALTSEVSGQVVHIPATSIIPVSNTSNSTDSLVQFSGPRAIGPHVFSSYYDHEYDKLYLTGRQIQILDYGNGEEPVSTVISESLYAGFGDLSDNIYGDTIYIESYQRGIFKINRIDGNYVLWNPLADDLNVSTLSLHNLLIHDHKLYSLIRAWNTTNVRSFYGLMVYDLQSGTTEWVNRTSSPVSIPNISDNYTQSTTQFLRDKDTNILYMSTDQGLWYWNLTNNENGYLTIGNGFDIVSGPDLPSNVTTFLTLDYESNVFYIGTHAGLFIYNRGTRTSQVLNTSNSPLIHNLINSIEIVKDLNTIFIACEEGGLLEWNLTTGNQKLYTQSNMANEVNPQLQANGISTAHYDESLQKLYVHAWGGQGATWVKDYANTIPFDTTQFYALRDLYLSTDGDQWTNRDGWPLAEELPQMGTALPLPSMDQISTWHGVTVVKDLIKRLDLRENGLTGIIPETISGLYGLHTLILSKNNLSGEIPSSIGDITTLRTLNLARNQLQGAVPEALGNLNKIVNFNVSRNQLTEVPATLANNVNLKSLHISFNQISNFSTDFQQLTKLVSLGLADNGFGLDVLNSVPPSVQKLYLQSNPLNGPLDPRILNLTNLELLHLTNTGTSGVIPPEIAQLTNLKKLFLGRNSIESIPHELTSLPLTDLVLASNALNNLPDFSGMTTLNLNVARNMLQFGELEPYLTGGLQIGSFKYNNQARIVLDSIVGFEPGQDVQLATSISGNNNEYIWEKRVPGDWVEIDRNFTGELSILSASHEDQGLFRLRVTNLDVPDLTLTSNNFDVLVLLGGTVEENRRIQFELLRDLYLSTDGDNWINNTGWPSAVEFNNTISSGAPLGPMTNCFGVTVQKEQVIRIVLKDNNLSGTLPASLGDAINMKNLNLSGNALSGPIPEEITNLTELKTLNFNKNELSGELPENIVIMDKLVSLNVSNNQLEGDVGILTDEGNRDNLRNLSIANNSFYGEILGISGPNLKTLNIAGNDFEGTIDIEPESVPNLERLFIQNNDFSGNLPDELFGFPAMTHLNVSRNDLTGSIPYSIENLENLKVLNLANNKLEDEIPEEVGFLTQLEKFNVANNEFVGEIPEDFASMDNLKLLNITNNNITSLADFTEHNNPSQIDFRVNNNRLNFEDIELFQEEEGAYIFGNFQFQSQQSLSVEFYLNNELIFDFDEDTVEFSTGDFVAFYAIIEGGNNSYNWQINRGNGWEDLAEEEPDIGWEIDAAHEQNQGRYRCTITNETVEGLVLETKEFYLSHKVVQLNEADRSQYEALRDLFYALDGENWEVSTWPSLENFQQIDEDGSFFGRNAYSSWDGVTVLDGKVTNLSLSGRGLSGVLPESLGNLDQLSFLNLDENAISGAIPMSINSLTKLSTLRLAENQITAIPSFGFPLGRLRYIHLNDNLIEGSMESFTSLPVVINIFLENNRISEMPADFFAELPTLRYLSLESNQLASFPQFDPATVSNLRFYFRFNNLGFGDLEQFFTAPYQHNFRTLDYFNQSSKEFTIETSYRVNINEDFELSYTIPGDNNMYQWQKQNTFGQWSDFGAPSETLSISNAQFSNQGGYRLYVTNSLMNMHIPVESIVIEPYPLYILEGLHQFYASTGGDNWSNRAGWPSEAEWIQMFVTTHDYPALEEIETWYGISVFNRQIRSINLPNNNLVGVIRGLDILDGLTGLYLNGNNLFSSVTYNSTGPFESLVTLDLKDTNIQGLGNTDTHFPVLNTLDLSRTKVKNLDELMQITSLQELNILSTNLGVYDGLPSSISNLTNLQRLLIADCNLRGTIPNGIGDLTQLRFLSLGQNNLSGVIPTSIGNLTNLESLYLSFNKLSGSIPSTIGNLDKVKIVQLEHNNLTGVLPTSINGLQSATFFWLNNNQLSGTLPAVWPQQLSNIKLSNNEFSGQIPGAITALPKATFLSLNNNNFTSWDGSRVNEMIDINLLDLSNNQINQAIPSNWNNPYRLSNIYLTGNKFTGEVPTSLMNIESLRGLWLDGNELTGFEPSPGQLINTQLSVRIRENRFGFEALAPYFSEPGQSIFSSISYEEQKVVLGELTTYEASPQFPVDFTFDHPEVGGPGAIYDLQIQDSVSRFEKIDGIYRPVRYLGYQDMYQFQDMSEAKVPAFYGFIFRFRVEHPLVTDLVLFTEPIEVIRNDEVSLLPPGFATPIPVNYNRVCVYFNDASTVEHGYTLYRSESEDGPFEKIGFREANPGTASALCFEDTDLLAGVTYYYKVGTATGEDSDVLSHSTGSIVMPEREAMGVTDTHLNWISQELYDDDGNLIAASKDYLNNQGRTNQSQELNITEGDPIVTTFTFDEFGRMSGQSLPYPSFSYIGYRDHQFRHQSGFSDFLTAEDYYSDFYRWLEPNRPFDTNPNYTISYSEDNLARTSTIPGEDYKINNGHETRTKTFPASMQELPGYVSLRANIVGGSNNVTNVFKSVGVDANQHYNVTFTDHVGSVIATATGGAEPYEVTLSADYYLNCFLPIQSNVLLAGTSSISIFKETDGESVLVQTVAGGASLNLDPGFYKFKSNDGIESVVSATYNVDYGSMSYYFYDLAGRQIRSIIPNGTDRYRKGDDENLVDQERFEYEQVGNVKNQQTSDGGTTEMVYIKNGAIRFSQDAQQQTLGNSFFNYIDYDPIGRILELGEHIDGDLIFNSSNMHALKDQFGYNNWNPNNKRDWTRYYYDEEDQNFAAETGLTGFVQNFVNGQLSHAENINNKTWLSYDERGRVVWVAQFFTQLNKVFTETYEYGSHGRLEKVGFQTQEPNETFYHHYTYDNDLRLNKILTSTSGDLEDAYEHVSHSYFMHGPLKSVNYANGLQEEDYTYTIQGWLKSINGIEGDPDFDGQNGVYPDAYGQVLDYSAGDFQSPGSWYSNPIDLPGIDQLHGGMITSARWKHLSRDNYSDISTGLYAYEYDSKYQLSASHYNGQGGFEKTNNAFGEKGLVYDLNGNLLSSKRYNSDGTILHDFENKFQYASGQNRLESIDGYVQLSYDKLGRIIGYNYDDPNENDQYYTYNNLSEITGVFSDANYSQKLFTYAYDERGNRILKRDESTGLEEWYVYDMSSSLIGIYYKVGNTTIQGELMIGTSYGIAYRDIDHWQYNYSLTDHQGNTRAVISKLKFMATATMEQARSSYENLRFDNLETRNLDVVNAIDGSYSALLNPALTGGNAIGPVKSLEVKKGDEIDMSVLVSYDPATSDNIFVSGLTGLITQALGGTAQLGDAGTGSLSSAVAGDAMVPAPSDARRPKAYLQYLLFDKDYNFIGNSTGGCDCYKVVTESANGGVESLELSRKISQDGFIYIYVANESANNVNVWFDNLTVTQTGLNIIQQTDYYSYGLVASNVEEQNYRFGYQGKYAEEDEETGLNNFQLRNYDPIIGRWLTLDPYDQFSSPYIGMGNTPHSSTDPDGGFSFTPTLIGAGIGLLGGTIYGLTQDKDNWALYAIGGGLAGGLVGEFGFKKIPTTAYSSGYGYHYSGVKYVPFFEAGQIRHFNFNVDPGLVLEFGQAMARFSTNSRARRLINRINRKGGIDIRRSSRESEFYYNQESPLVNGKNYINWNAFEAIEFTDKLGNSLYSTHPTALILYHELSHAAQYARVGNAKYNRLSNKGNDYFQDKVEEFAVKNTNRLARKLGYQMRMGYVEGGKANLIPVLDVWNIKPIKGKFLKNFWRRLKFGW